MFQTEPIYFIQSIANDAVTAIFNFISSLGSMAILSILLLVLMFGIDFRKGFLLIQTAMLTISVTGFFKEIFALPRPFMIDSNLMLEGVKYSDPADFKTTGATSFFGALPGDIIQYYRNLGGDIGWGLPSGHSSGAIAVWGSIATLFRKTWVLVISCLMIILLPLSRVYQGKHFLADIFAGLLLGGLILLGMYFFSFRDDKYLRHFEYLKDVYKKKFNMILLPAIAILVPLIFGAFLGGSYTVAGLWAGLNLAVLLMYRFIKDDSATLGKRILRALITIAIFYVIRLIIGEIPTPKVSNFTFMIKFISGFLILFLTISASIWINLKLKLFSGVSE
ncbi:MAG: phosphatase PAP2 family protein [Acidobacteria bacterium]|nr:phosphatase PAP2 family protein [Acidobacteriota bacterium]